MLFMMPYSHSKKVIKVTDNKIVLRFFNETKKEFNIKC